MMKTLNLCMYGMMALLLAPVATAGTITFTGSGTAAGNPVSASAVFTITGTSLTITLTNTSGPNDNQDVPGSTLTGLFFDLGTSNPELAPVSATLFGDSSIVQAGECSSGACAGVTDVGGEFGYNVDGADGNNFGGRGSEGIASSGYLKSGVPGDIGNFNNGGAGTDLDSPASLDGINFGLISSASGFNPNGGLSKEPLIQDSVQFVLNLPDATFDVGDISNVSFQYGTSFSETNICATEICRPVVSVPEPNGLLLLGFGLLGVGALSYANRKRRGHAGVSRRIRNMLELDDYLSQDTARH